MADTPTRAKLSGAAESKDEEQIAIARTLRQVPWCEQYERMISGMLYVQTSYVTTHLLILG
jgi:hypothetical protein